MRSLTRGMADGAARHPSLRQRLGALRLWRSRGQRAPHKPLLLLWAFGRCLRGEERLAPYPVVETALRELLRAFGPSRQSLHPEFPFWRLAHDGVWEIDQPHLVGLSASGDPHVRDLHKHDICGGLLASDYDALRAVPQLANELAEELLYAHFPETYHASVLWATGIGGARADAERRKAGIRQVAEDHHEYETTRRLRRNADFTAIVRRAYAEKCAVCGFSVRMAGKVLALEAAHIHWLSYAGPSEVRNGLALCSLHHSLFDHGAFGLQDDLVIRVSRQATGQGHQDSLGRFDGTPLPNPPNASADRPAPEFLSWHRHEVLWP